MEKNRFLLIYFALPALLLLIAASKSLGPSEWARIGGGFRAPARLPGRRKYLLTDADGHADEVYAEPADWSYEASSLREAQSVNHRTTGGRERDRRGETLRRSANSVVGDTSGTTAVRRDTSGTTSQLSVVDSSGNATKTAQSDSISQADSLKLSAWLQHMRPAHVQAPIFEPYHYPLFLTSSATQYSTLLDTTGKYMEIRETVLGHDIRYPLQIPLDEYIKIERRHLIKETWEGLAHAYILRSVGGLESLMAGVTNISIPIPSNPVLSIFGPPRINLQVSGSVDIQGGWRNQKLNAQTLSQLGNVTNQPAFNQSLQINVNGTIGNKLHIGASWDTQNQFNYENQVKLKYTGYPDEIVQSVEAGNVSMNTPSSFIGNSQALFGLKAKFQFGPLTLTALASQQKGQSKTLSVSNGSSSQTFSLHAYQFSTNHFFIDTMYIGEYERYYQNSGNQFDANKLVTNYEVYISQPSSALNTNLRKGFAVIDLPSVQDDPGFYDSLRTARTANQGTWQTEGGYFEKLKSSEFSINPRTGVLTLNTSFQSNQVVAIAFSTANGQVYGTFANTDTSNLPLVLNMIVPANPIPSETDAWRLMLRNIYPTGGLNLDQNSLKNVQIVYTVPGQASENTISNINLLQVFGLDKTGPNGTGPPDGVMDWNPGIDVDPTSGEIILPYLEPFVEAFKDYVGPQGQKIATPDSFTYSAIYDTTLQSAQNDFSSRDRFLLTGSYTSSVTSHYNLGFNLVQGSVKVLLNGSPLTPGVDYTVDYVTGEVQILDQAALQPGANVQIQYQTNDLFQLASKSLSGLRADYRINKSTDIGFTLMNYSQQSPVSNIRLGQEPISNLMLEADAGTVLQLPFLTTALNALPILQTAAPSSITFHGEAAYMLPNPNTSQSVIPSDHHQGMAYIDDFEGAKKTIPLPITFSNWTMASPPAVSVLDSLHPGIVDSVKNYYRAWTYWYNRLPGETSVKAIWPQKQVSSSQQTQTVLSIGMLDSVRGQFNRTKNLDSTLMADPQQNWGGMMTLLSSNASDLLSQNITYIEIWMKVIQAPGPGTMHIDLGQISEDVVGDGVLHTEDPFGYNALVSDTLDYGIDGMNDAKERADFPWIVANSGRPWDPTGLDPDGDDYYFNNSATNPHDSAYYRVNGTEGNHITSWGKFPDTEDLNHNGTLDLLNSYYEYAVKLDTVKNKFIAGGGSNGWYQYIIPLQDYSRAIGSPTLSNVQYVRVWFNGMTAPMRIKIAKMELVGNYWKSPNPNDSTMQVSVVSVEDNPGYTPPAPGLRPVVNSSTSGPLLGNEQSLALILNGLQDDSTRYVYKVFPQAMNVFNYRTMKMYVHGDPSFNYVDSTDYDASVYLRFGTDANNFYEYRQPIKPGWQDFVINLASLTSLKETRDSVNQAIPPVPADNGAPGSTYWVQGNPSLQNVTYFQIGVVNPPHTGTPLPLTGEIWVDVLRLTNVNNTPGLAYQLSSSLQLADLGSISFNYTSISPYFHSLTTQFGNLNAQLNWGISGSLNLSRFLPRAWVGTTIPFYYNHTESFSNPLYLPNSDVLVSEAVKRRTTFLMSQGFTRSRAATLADSLLLSSQSITVNNQWSISNMRIVLPSNLWYVKDIVDNVTMGFNWSGSNFRNTQTRYGNQWSWQYNAGYSVQLDPMAFITPFASVTKGVAGQSNDFQIRYLPNSFSLSMNANRSLTINDLWSQTTPIITPNFVAQRGGGFTWQLTNNGILNPSISYNFSVNSSLVSLESDTNSTGGLQLLPDSYVFKQIFLNGGLINFGEDYGFSEQFALSTSPHLPFGVQKYLNLQASYNSGYQWNNSAQQGPLGKSAGFNSSLQLGTNLYLKSLTDPWFSGGTAAYPAPARGPGRGRGREEFSAPKTDTSSGNSESIGKLLDILVKIPFLDFQNIGLNFSSTNTATNGGLPSLRPGMGNFFMIPFAQQSNPELGPSQLYQLGLVSDPYGVLSLKPKTGFPFFQFSLGPTRRVAISGVNITDNFSNSNNVTITTSRSLWSGAQLNLSWNVAWSYNRNTTFSVDSGGYIIPSSISTQVSGQITKSFFTLPPVFIFSAFKSGINQVAADYKNLQASDPGNTKSTPAQKMSQAFLQGFETFPVLQKIFGQYAPDLNYSFSWDGLENLPLFKTFASQVSLNDAYQSSYSQSWTNTDGQGIVTNAQSVAYGFQPLLGMNIAFKNFTNATISGSILYNTSTQYSLNPSAQTIAESYTGQLSVTAQYQKQGLSLPFLGLNFKNNISISASYSVSQTTSYSYQLQNISGGSTPIDGTSQISLDLQFQYSLSSQVTASLYYKNTRIVPTAPGSPIPGTTTNEAGVNVHVSIGS